MSSSKLSLFMLGGAVVMIVEILLIMRLGPRWKFAAKYGERFWMMVAFWCAFVGDLICCILSFLLVFLSFVDEL